MDKKIIALRKALSNMQEVCSKPCDQCLFSKKKIVGDERAEEILEACEKENTHFMVALRAKTLCAMVSTERKQLFIWS